MRPPSSPRPSASRRTRPPTEPGLTARLPSARMAHRASRGRRKSECTRSLQRSEIVWRSGSGCDLAGSRTMPCAGEPVCKRRLSPQRARRPTAAAPERRPGDCRAAGQRTSWRRSGKRLTAPPRGHLAALPLQHGAASRPSAERATPIGVRLRQAPRRLRDGEDRAVHRFGPRRPRS
jgi:hypothetical protein